jgi:carboxyl-terminal processing protease
MRFKNFNLVILLVVLTTLIGGAGASERAGIGEEWKTVSLEIVDLYEIFEQSVCDAHAINYVACFQAAQRLVSLLSPTQKLVHAFEPVTYKHKQNNMIGQSTMRIITVLDEKSATKTLDELVKNEKLVAAMLEREHKAGIKFPVGKIDEMFLENAKDLPKPEQAKIATLVKSQFLLITRDPHTSLEPAAKFRKEKKAKEVTFTGIGTVLQMIGGNIYARPLPGYPAEKFGMLADDVIVSVNGQTKFESLQDAVDVIRGPKDTQVVIGVKRGDEIKNITITRAQVKERTVYSEIVESVGEKKSKVGVIHLTRFKDGVCEKIKNFVKSADEKVDVFAMNFLDNPGGFVHEAMCIGGIFLGNGEIMNYALHPIKDTILEINKTTGKKLTDKPLAIYVNQGSASASELVAGAMQDHNRGVVIGIRSFGKGTMQDIVGIGNGLLKKNTFARFHQPNRTSNQGQGIYPDVKLERHPEFKDSPILREEDRYLLPIRNPNPRKERELNSIVQNCTLNRAAATLPMNSKAIAALGCILDFAPEMFGRQSLGIQGLNLNDPNLVEQGQSAFGRLEKFQD